MERTRLLVTFGSPLDMIALIFASQWVRATETREALAASFQPLILDYERFRTIPWVNIWSPADIISGGLGFFDENRVLFEQIHAGLTRQDVVSAVAR